LDALHLHRLAQVRELLGGYFFRLPITVHEMNKGTRALLINRSPPRESDGEVPTLGILHWIRHNKTAPELERLVVYAEQSAFGQDLDLQIGRGFLAGAPIRLNLV
jgi:hypothetical protein